MNRGPGYWKCHLCGIESATGGGDGLSEHVYRCHYKPDVRGIWTTR